METPTSPGWYDDPENPQQLRYFDGVIWTRHTTSRGAPQPQQQAAAQAPTAPGVPDQPAQHAPSGRAARQGHPGQPGQPGEPGQPGQPGQPQGWPSQYPSHGGWNAPPAGVRYRALPTTPDGQPLAGWWKRAAARVVDWIIVWFCALPFTGYFLYRAGQAMDPMVDSLIRDIESGTGSAAPLVNTEVLRWMIPYLVVFTLVAMAYEVAFTTRSGATPGKKLLGLKVRLRDQPGPLPFQAALTRTLIPMGANMLAGIPLVSTLLGLVQVIDVVLPVVNERKQALHDLMARTNVVDTRA